MRTIRRNSFDVKAHIEHLWEDRCAFVAAQIRRYPIAAVLAAVANATGGASLATNIAVLIHNARVGARVAIARSAT